LGAIMISKKNMIQEVNHSRYRRGQKDGHYESYFIRANHSEKPQAFWIRFTLFQPESKPEETLGELWAILFDQKSIKSTGARYIVFKREVPLANCLFSIDSFNVKIATSVLENKRSRGSIENNGNSISWDLTFVKMKDSVNCDPLFLLPIRLYTGTFPKAKSVVSLPFAKFNGAIELNGKKISIKNWVGSQNHNWGLKHTDHYAWGQVCGFDNQPDSFFEIITARLKFGPFWTPFMTLLVFRHKGREIRLNKINQGLRAHGNFNYFEWNFHSENEYIKIEGRIKGHQRDFAGLQYYDPPGGSKDCLNSKIAFCEVNVTYKDEGKIIISETLFTYHRAAFEILTSDKNHGIEIKI
jgi:hypothetical protein